MYSYLLQNDTDNYEEDFGEAEYGLEDYLQRRNEELLKFIDEFITSEEYTEYVEHKRNIPKKCVLVQYDENDFIELPKIVEKKYPLTAESKKFFAFTKQFEKFVKNEENLEILRRQEEGIQIIKNKISELKVILNCMRERTQAHKDELNEKYLKTFCDTFNINYNSIKLKNKMKVEERIVCYQKIIHTRNIKRKLNTIHIVKKLTEEYARKKPEKKVYRVLKQTDTYQAGAPDLSVGILDIDIDTQKEITDQSMDKADVEMVVEDTPEEPKKVKRKDKATMAKDKKKGKKKKSSTTKSSKKSKKSPKKDPSLLVLPVAPLCNKRYKINLEGKEKMSQLLEDFRKFDELMEDQHMLSQEVCADLGFDDNFLCKPDTIYFNNFEREKRYKKKCLILNKSRGIRKFRLSTISSPDEYDTLLFEIHPLLGIQKVASGCSVVLAITFSSPENPRPIEAVIEFLSYDIEDEQYQQFFVNIKCMPPHANLKISQSDVFFGRMFIWQAQRSNATKMIKLKNEGKKPCKAVIKKVFDPLELIDPVTDDEENHSLTDDFPKDIVEEVFDNVFNNFSFQQSFVRLNGLEDFKLEVNLKNIEHEGNYFEKYLLDVYEEDEFVGSQEFVVSAEVNGHFLELSPEVLDFGVCILNSVYQVGLDIYNSSSCTQTIAVKFPSSVVDYIKPDVSNLYIPSQTRRTIWIKFLPRKHIFTESITYFDESTRILEFPVHVCVISRNYFEIPPVKGTIFAVLTEQNKTNIIPTKEEFCDYFPNGAVLDMGECTIYETVYTDIIIENETFSPQIYGFIDLPQCLTISPNFGFGELDPGEKKTLSVYYHPTIEDIKKFLVDGKFKDHRVELNLNLETLTSIGQRKQTLDGKKLRNSIELMLKELRNHGDNNNVIVRDMKICMQSIKSTYYSESNENEGLSRVQLEYEGEGYNEFGRIPPRNPTLKEDLIKRSQLTIRAEVVRPLLEISCQHVELPETPCGSYSTTEIELTALRTEYASVCDFMRNKSKQSLPNYEAWFKITGDNDQIRIEPSCGILEIGKARKIVLIAKPTALDDIVRDTAKSIKYSEIYEMKKREIELAKNRLRAKKKSKKDKRGGKGDKKKKDKKEEKKENEKKEKKEKKKKGGKGKTGTSQHDTAKTDDASPEITVTEEELELTYLDYYPAEMCYWRSLEPYTMKSKLICNINYDSPNMIRKQETIYVDVFCKVIRPDFITNLKQQRINFGTVTLGMKSTECIILQNINYNSIEPKFSLVSPVGPFRIPYLKNCEVPPENYLKIPITFEPVLDKKFEEYFEIFSGKTVLPLILEGTGIAPELEFKPNTLVYRLNTKANKVAECTLEIANKCSADVTIIFEKALELEGYIISERVQKEKPESHLQKKEVEKKSKKKSGKDKKSDKKSKKSAKSKKAAPPPKFSDTLTEAEESSINKSFIIREGESFFDILNIDANQVNVPGNSKKLIKLGFGTTEALLKRKMEMKEKKKGGKKGKAAKNKGSSGKSKESKKGADVTYYLAKFNIKIRNIFIKDVILVCYFK